jgi:hypothetical protein
LGVSPSLFHFREGIYHREEGEEGAKGERKKERKKERFFLPQRTQRSQRKRKSI